MLNAAQFDSADPPFGDEPGFHEWHEAQYGTSPAASVFSIRPQRRASKPAEYNAWKRDTRVAKPAASRADRRHADRHKLWAS